VVSIEAFISCTAVSCDILFKIIFPIPGVTASVRAPLSRINLQSKNNNTVKFTHYIKRANSRSAIFCRCYTHLYHLFPFAGSSCSTQMSRRVFTSLEVRIVVISIVRRPFPIEFHESHQVHLHILVRQELYLLPLYRCSKNPNRLSIPRIARFSFHYTVLPFRRLLPTAIKTSKPS